MENNKSNPSTGTTTTSKEKVAKQSVLTPEQEARLARLKTVPGGQILLDYNGVNYLRVRIKNGKPIKKGVATVYIAPVSVGRNNRFKLEREFIAAEFPGVYADIYETSETGIIQLNKENLMKYSFSVGVNGLKIDTNNELDRFRLYILQDNKSIKRDINATLDQLENWDEREQLYLLNVSANQAKKITFLSIKEGVIMKYVNMNEKEKYTIYTLMCDDLGVPVISSSHDELKVMFHDFISKENKCRLVDSWLQTENRKDVNLTALVVRAINHGIIIFVNNSYRFTKTNPHTFLPEYGESIGFSKQEVVKFFSLSENHEKYAELAAAVEAKAIHSEAYNNGASKAVY